MAVRIYSLAKDLKVDSKELVDICTQIGIGGKGSALASLSDDEVVKIQDYFKGGAGAKATTKGGGGGGAAAAPERPRERAQGGGKMPVISTPRPTGPLSGLRKGQREDEAPPAEDDEPAVLEAAEAATAEEAIAPVTRATPLPHAEPEGPRSPGPLAGRMRRDEYIGPGGATGKPPALENKLSGGAGNAPGGGGKPAGTPPPRMRPAIKLAPMPTVEPQKPTRAKAGEAVMKPDMKLPADALRASKSGSKPLAAHLRRHEDAVDAAKKKTLAEEESAKAAKGRRGGKLPPAKGEEGPMLGGREERQLARRRTPTSRGDDDGSRGPRRYSRQKRRSTGVKPRRRARSASPCSCPARCASCRPRPACLGRISCEFSWPKA